MRLLVPSGHRADPVSASAVSLRARARSSSAGSSERVPVRPVVPADREHRGDGDGHQGLVPSEDAVQTGFSRSHHLLATPRPLIFFTVEAALGLISEIWP